MAKIAMIVSNPCFPDYRVIKEAESLASLGHHVRIYCVARPGIPIHEVVSGVEYVRIPFGVGPALRSALAYFESRRRKRRRKKLDIVYREFEDPPG